MSPFPILQAAILQLVSLIPPSHFFKGDHTLSSHLPLVQTHARMHAQTDKYNLMFCFSDNQELETDPGGRHENKKGGVA